MKYRYFFIIPLILLFAIAIVPVLIPSDTYKSKIYEVAGNYLERKIDIDGKVSVSILPSINLKLNDIKISSLPHEKQPYLVTSNVINVKASLLSLIFGNIKINNIELIEPKIFLETNNKNENNWDYILITKQAATNSNKPITKKEQSSANFIVKNFVIKDGFISYLKDNKNTEISKINIKSSISNPGAINFTAGLNVGGNNLSFNGDITNFNQKIASVNLGSKMFDDVLNVVGDFDKSTKNFTGNISLNGNMKNIISKSSNNYAAALLEDYKFNSGLIISDNQLILDNITYAQGIINGKGQGKYLIDKKQGSVNFNLNPGNLDIKLNLTAAAEQKNSLIIHSSNIAPLLEIIGIKQDIIKNAHNHAFKFEATGNYLTPKLIVDNLNLSYGNSIVNGNVTAEILTDNMKFNYDVKANNLESLTSLFGYNNALKEDLHIAGNTLKTNKSIHTDTKVAFSNITTHIVGDVANDNLKSSLAVNVDGKNLHNTIANINIPPGIRNFNINASIKGELLKAFVISIQPSSIDVANEKSTFAGLINIDKSNNLINANIDIGSFDIDKLMNAPNKAVKSSNVTHNPPVEAAHSWSNKKIELGFLKTINGNLNLKIGKLSKGSIILDNVNGKFLVKDGDLDISAFNSKIYGGNLDISGKISSNSTQNINVKASVTGANLSNISHAHNDFKLTKGLFNLNGNLNTQGHSELDYVNNLNGDINFDTQNGKFNGIDLQKIFASLRNPKDIEGIFNLLNDSISGGSTDFNALKGKLLISNGIVNIDNFDLNAVKVDLIAKGLVNLPKYNMDVNAQVKVDYKNLPPISIKFTGPLNHPHRKLDFENIKKNLLKNLFNNAIEGAMKGNIKPDKLIKGLFGSDNSDNKDNSAKEDNEKSPINNLIEKNLGNLLPGF
jgi:AsmA protein